MYYANLQYSHPLVTRENDLLRTKLPGMYSCYLVINWQAWVGHARFEQTATSTHIVLIILWSANNSIQYELQYTKPTVLVHYFTTRYTPVHQKWFFHYNKQQWTTQQLASAPTFCTATRTSEATSTTRHNNVTGIDGPSNQQQKKEEPKQQEEVNQGQQQPRTISNSNCKPVAMALAVHHHQL
jgi:hypothetical protein